MIWIVMQFNRDRTDFSKWYATSIRTSPVVQAVKNLPAGRRHGFHPWVRKIPWRRAWHPTPVFLPGESHGQRGLVDHSPWGHEESHSLEQEVNMLLWGGGRAGERPRLSPGREWLQDGRGRHFPGPEAEPRPGQVCEVASVVSDSL